MYFEALDIVAPKLENNPEEAIRELAILNFCDSKFDLTINFEETRIFAVHFTIETLGLISFGFGRDLHQAKVKAAYDMHHKFYSFFDCFDPPDNWSEFELQTKAENITKMNLFIVKQMRRRKYLMKQLKKIDSN